MESDIASEQDRSEHIEIVEVSDGVRELVTIDNEMSPVAGWAQ